MKLVLLTLNAKHIIHTNSLLCISYY